MADEAHQTSQHDHSTWGQYSNLRSQPIRFRSVGLSEPLKSNDTARPDGRTWPQVLQVSVPKGQQCCTDRVPGRVPEQPDTDHEGVSITGSEDLGQAIQTEAQENYEDTPATAPFVYDIQGEKTNRGPVKPTPIHVPQRRSSSVSNSSGEIILFRGRNGIQNRQKYHKVPGSNLDTEPHVGKPKHSTLYDSVTHGNPPEAITTHLAIRPRRRSRGVPSTGGDQRKRHRDEEEAILADYVANMRENGVFDGAISRLPLMRRDMGGAESDLTDYDASRRNETTKKYSQGDESLGIVTASELQNIGGPVSSRADQGDKGIHIDVDEKFSTRFDRFDHCALGLGRRVDEFKARTQSKCDSSSASSLDGMNIVRSQIGNSVEFDFMDWERSNLRGRKGRNYAAEMGTEGRDSEMERQLLMAWKNDRLKKKQRKQQREELRVIGLLGKAPKPNDLLHKYPSGITIQEVAEELRGFLMGVNER